MPIVDKRAQALTRTNTTSNANAATKHKTSGNLTVKYSDVKGRSFNARVLGPGTASGLKLCIDGIIGGNRFIDNVPVRSAINQTNCYVSRLP